MMKDDFYTKFDSNIRENPWILILVPLSILLLGCLLHFLRGSYGVGDTTLHSWGADDAYITYRYSWNLANHGILSWNESGFRRTEGFTNPLWVFMAVPWSRIGIKDWVYPLSVLTSVIISTMFFLFLIKAVVSKQALSFPSILGLVAVACVPAIWLHMTSGLEGGVFGVGLALLAYLALFPPKKTITPFLLVILSIFLGFLRSDGFIYLGIIVIAALIAGTNSWRAIVIGLLISSIILFAWRYFSFGTFLPNTAVAKVNFSLFERIPIALIFLRASMFNSGLIVFLFFGLAGLWLEPRRIFLAGLFIAISWIAYYIYIGGDGYIERHLIGLYFLMAAFSTPLWIDARPRTRLFLLLVVFISGFISVSTYQSRFDYISSKTNDPWIMLGKAVESDRARYGVLISFTAGKIPFYAGGDNIDMIGLNDPYLATLKGDSFVPGHSSGNTQAAITLAKSHGTGVYSTFSYLDPDFISSPEDISIWVNNLIPQDKVNYKVTDEQWNSAKSADNIFIWSIISNPIIISR